ncbi:MAG: hypothetical protein WKG07_44350 [Hymenobacter sp.]
MVHRYRTRLVQHGREPASPEAVEVLTATDAGPLLLGWLAQVASSGPLLVAGPGASGEEPLHALELSQAAVLRLCGNRAKAAAAFRHHLAPALRPARRRGPAARPLQSAGRS